MMRTRTNPARARAGAFHALTAAVVASFALLMSAASTDLALLSSVVALGFAFMAFHKFSTLRQP
jgi:hypothetical protein